MSSFLTGLFVVQLLLVIYQFTFLGDAGRVESNARATRIPDIAVISQMVMSFCGLGLWFGWRVFEVRAWAWVTFAVILIAAIHGTVIAQRALREPPVIEGGAEDPADLRTAEGRIPEISQYLLGAATWVLVILVLLVAAGVF